MTGDLAKVEERVQEHEQQKQSGLSASDISAKILHVLGIYPIISPTMLQSGIGAYIKPAEWREVLADLVKRGKVVEDTFNGQTPTGRYNSYNLLSLPGTKVQVRGQA